MALASLTIPMFILLSPMAPRMSEVFSNLYTFFIFLYFPLTCQHQVSSLYSKAPLMRCYLPSAVLTITYTHRWFPKLTLHPITLTQLPTGHRLLNASETLCNHLPKTFSSFSKPISISGNGTCTYYPISPSLPYAIRHFVSPALPPCLFWHCSPARHVHCHSLCLAHCLPDGNHNTWPQEQ